VKERLPPGFQFDVVGAQGPRAYFALLTPRTLAHAYIFTGPEGVGKKTFARRLAQSLLCTAPKDGVIGYDETCASCRLFSKESHHPDFLEHEGSLRIGDRDTAAGFGADELTARDIVRQLSFESYTGGMRVLLLADVDFATHHSANALLKFLEEPPRGVVLLMTTPAPSRLLPTIRSRAIAVRFPLLTRREVAEILRRKGYDREQIELGAQLAQGSASRSIAALESEETSLRKLAARWFFDVVGGKTPEGNWAARETLESGLETIKGLVRDWVAIATLRGEPLFMDYAAELRKLSPLEHGRMASMLSRLDEAQRMARTNVSPTVVSEFVRMGLAP
jgi:DNA polymerase III delta prime subunit